jgi:hypothetical protein
MTDAPTTTVLTVTPAPDWTSHLNLASPAWWTWAASAALLLAGAAGSDVSRLATMPIAAGQAALYLVRHRSLAHFATQVRVAYAIWMAASFAPFLLPLFWIQTAGTTALVLFGYCPLARMLLLLPSNRSVPLTPRRVARIFLHPTTAGSVRRDLSL